MVLFVFGEEDDGRNRRIKETRIERPSLPPLTTAAAAVSAGKEGVRFWVRREQHRECRRWWWTALRVLNEEEDVLCLYIYIYIYIYIINIIN